MLRARHPRELLEHLEDLVQHVRRRRILFVDRVVHLAARRGDRLEALAARSDKTARNFHAGLSLAAPLQWV